MCACSFSFITMVSVFLSLMHGAFFVGMLRTRVGRGGAHSPASTCGCPVARVCVALWSGWCVAKGPGSVCRMTSNLPWPMWKPEPGTSEFALVKMGQLLGSTFWRTITHLLLPADVMVWRQKDNAKSSSKERVGELCSKRKK